MLKIHLLIIDPQNDFCEPNGSLCVPGAENDMKNTAELINRIGDRLSDIHVTLDTHHLLDIAHPTFWIDGEGNSPPPFTTISIDDVEGGKWRAKTPAFQKRALKYVKSLKDNDRYDLCIWPPHCLIGSWGTSVYQPLYQTLLDWAAKYGWIDYVTKGSNMFTEHYSAVLADVVDPEDPTTALNTNLIQILEEADMVLVAGEASSHCVANTLKDIIGKFGADSAKKVTLLTDCMSPVPRFENLADEFFTEMKSKGVKMAKSTEILN